MVIMSVDVGDARSGIAVCDKGEMLASPVCVIEEYNAQKRLEKVKQKALELGAECVVVGLPKNMDGSEGDRAKSCREFASELSKLLDGIEVDLCDERATTMLAHTYLSITDVKGRKRKKTVDAVAAVIILESYLAMRKNKVVK
ncbi:MAG: Holliday junction resolvase RuvX [Ruminococcaceae bacterium]|nr:Holliday junction resolvase RuvX [Oscillospiraceae bacterium]